MTMQELQAKEKQELKEPDRTRPGRSYVPDVDIREDEGALRLWVDLPGVTQDKISVDLNEGVLTIRGEISANEYDGLTPLYTEYNVGNFVRRFTLPETSRYDAEKIAARVWKGVLELELPKTQQVRQRRIPVQAA